MPMQSSPESPQPLAKVVLAVKDWVERLGRIWVDAQVIELRRRSGPTQFLTLRDRHEEYSVTVTSSRATLDAAGPLTEGAQVAALLRPRVWPVTGRLSFEALEIRIRGEGRLLAELERRRRMLQAEGLFAPEMKRALPFAPTTIGLIAGQGSDAERDVLVNARKRWPAARFEVANTLVQGPRAAAEVIAALARLDADPRVGVVVIARGGGSLEDLLPFSDEALLRAVFAATTPVVSAIGHEADNPLLDLVADARASTPTEAAKMVTPDAAAEAELMAQARDRMARAALARLDRLAADLAQVRARPSLADPMAGFAAHGERVAQLRLRARQAARGRVGDARSDVDHLLARLRALSPRATLSRGYAILSRGPETIASVAQAARGDKLAARLADGTLRVEVVEVSDAERDAAETR